MPASKVSAKRRVGGGGGGAGRKGGLTDRAGLVLPVPRVRKHLKRATGKRVSLFGAAALTGAIEMMLVDIVNGAQGFAGREKRTRITPRNLMYVMDEDPAYKKVCRHPIVPIAGVVPRLHPNLLRPIKHYGKAWAPAILPDALLMRAGRANMGGGEEEVREAKRKTYGRTRSPTPIPPKRKSRRRGAKSVRSVRSGVKSTLSGAASKASKSTAG